MKDLEALINLMFEPGETICISNSKYAYHSMTIESVLSGKVVLVSPNQNVETSTVNTEELILLCINSVNGYRLDENVTSHRTFLWEIDVGALSSQMEYMKALNLPYSAAIYSGNKSIHYITVLEEPIEPKLYRKLYAWALNIGTLFDPSCKNPSRSVRIPGAIRPDTGKEQKLISIKSRVKLEELMDWLKLWSHLEPKERPERKALTNEKDYNNLSRWARDQLENGIDFSKGRNRSFFALACDLYQSGYSESEAIEILELYFVEEHDFKYKEFITSINSAFKFMGNNGESI